MKQTQQIGAINSDCEKVFGSKKGASNSLRQFQRFYHHPHYIAEIPVPTGNSFLSQSYQKKNKRAARLNFSRTELNIPRIIFKVNYANVRIWNEECNKVRMRIDLRANYRRLTDLAFNAKVLCS